MRLWIDTAIVILILTNLKLISSSRLSASIRAVTLQGILLGFLPLFVAAESFSHRMIFLSILTISIKGIVFPWLLLRTLRAVGVNREMEPFVGYTQSLIVGIGLLGLAMWLAGRLPLPFASRSALMVPLSFFTIMIGLFVIIGRRKALTQILGYLVMENGIYAFGLAFAHQAPLLVELGTLLDVFMAVFVMGITIFHINREFDHIDTDLLSSLRD
jgi:hydrogenase-4 component E